MQRWIPVLIAASMVTAACDDNDNGATSPTDLPVVFSTILRPANEVPPVANAESTGIGAAQITFHLTRDAAGAITGATADFYFQASGFTGDTRVVGAHIHPGVAGVNGPVIIPTSLTATAPHPLSGGTGEFTQTGIPVSAVNANAVINNPEAFYFNIHSPLNPGGFARGQLTRIR